MIYIDLQYEVLLVFSCLVTSILVIWYLTSAFVEYTNLLGLGDFLLVKRYEEYVDETSNYHTTYPEFLKIRSKSFLFKILECPFCSGFWLSVMICIKIGFIYLPVLYLLSLLQFFVIKKMSRDNG